jgi:beta-glucosidase-like glycosyl hydrolase
MIFFTNDHQLWGNLLKRQCPFGGVVVSDDNLINLALVANMLNRLKLHDRIL